MVEESFPRCQRRAQAYHQPLKVQRYRFGVSVDSYPMKYAPAKPGVSVKTNGGPNVESRSMDPGSLPVQTGPVLNLVRVM